MKPNTGVAEALTISRLAQAIGASRETVRFYEREGLLRPPARSAAGYRLYPVAAIRVLRFIQRAKELGFTLAEVRELLNLRGGAGHKCADARQRALAKVADIERRMADLKRMKEALARLAAACEKNEPLGECAILKHLELENQE